jgi:hypothetical protein
MELAGLLVQDAATGGVAAVERSVGGDQLQSVGLGVAASSGDIGKVGAVPAEALRI